jgi:hypothetical protein
MSRTLIITDQKANSETPYCSQHSRSPGVLQLVLDVCSVQRSPLFYTAMVAAEVSSPEVRSFKLRQRLTQRHFSGDVSSFGISFFRKIWSQNQVFLRDSGECDGHLGAKYWRFATGCRREFIFVWFSIGNCGSGEPFSCTMPALQVLIQL